MASLSLLSSVTEDRTPRSSDSALTFAEDGISLGMVPHGVLRPCGFTFRNVSTRAVCVTRVTTTAGCRVINWPSTPVSPGAEGAFEVVIAVASGRTNQREWLTVITDEAGGGVYRLHVDVRPAAPIHFDPRVLEMTSGRDRRLTRRTVELNALPGVHSVQVRPGNERLLDAHIVSRSATRIVVDVTGRAPAGTARWNSHLEVSYRWGTDPRQLIHLPISVVAPVPQERRGRVSGGFDRTTRSRSSLPSSGVAQGRSSPSPAGSQGAADKRGQP
ncbi:MAG: DUF1573 domain-containing protein [Planctomycetota bacterium]